MPKSKSFESLGTSWTIESLDLTPQQGQDVNDWLRSFEQKWSRFLDDSLITQLSQRAGELELSPSEYGMMSFYRQLYQVSDGRITPFIGRALENLGYDRDYSFRPKEMATYTPVDWDQAMTLSPDRLTMLQPVLLDIGAVGKGYAVDQVAEILGSVATIDAGGDIKVGTSETIGLQHPHDPDKVIGQVTITNAALCASSIYLRSWRGVHHILDGRTGQPATSVAATWVIADSAMQADGLATALFFVSPDQLISLGLRDYCIIYTNGDVSVPSSSKIKLFTAL